MYRDVEKNKNKNSIELAGETRMQNGSLLRNFIASERGATAIEYALIAGGISVVIVGAVGALGLDISALFVSVQAGFN